MARIDSNAFKSDKSIAKINFGSQCKSVGDSAFQGCTLLQEINTDNVITIIRKSAFESTGLKSVTFNKLILLSDGAFMNCSELNTVNMKPLSAIPSISFLNCSSLVTIDTPSVENIGTYAFYNCISLETIDMPNVENIEIYAFQNCTKLKSFNFEKCKNIGSFAFNKCVSLEKINLYICESIDDYAFYECSGLKEVYINIPSNIKCELKNINAFSNTHTDITFYFTPETLKNYYFHNIWGYFKEKMKYIQQNNQIIYTTQQKNNNYIKIKQSSPDSNPIKENGYNNDVETIPMLNYGWVTFRDKVEELNMNIFNMETSGRNSITSIQIPPECESIGDYLFQNYTVLNEIKLSDTLMSIGEYAFRGCGAFKLFKIPESVISLGEGAFAGCTNIEEIEGGNEQVITYDDCVVFKNTLKNTLICVLPKKVNEIYQISKDITRLGKYCFYGCNNMKVVDISSNITEIGDNAFAWCKNLCEVHFNGDNPPELGINVFEDCLPTNSNPKDFKIFVPEKSKDTYINKYKNLEQYIYPIKEGYEVFVVSYDEKDGGTIKVQTQEDVFGVKLS